MKKKIEKEKKVGKKVCKPGKKPYIAYGAEPDDPDYVQPKTHKILGYCPKCDLALMKNDFVSKMIFECPCGCRKHSKYMLVESKREKKRRKISKAQYLKETKSIRKGEPASGHHVSNLPDISLMNKVDP